MVKAMKDLQGAGKCFTVCDTCRCG